jgi:hypothetical protein
MKNTICIKAIVSQLVLVLAIYVFQTGSIFAQSVATTYYVDAQKGNDSNNGLSLDKPFKTIVRAKQAIHILDKTPGNNITVNLRGGVYLQDKTLVFNEKDGGTASYQVTYKNYKDESPVISGGKLISGWKLFDKDKNIYRAQAKTFEFRQLYVNGVRAQRARFPNAGSNYLIEKWDTAQGQVVVKKEQVSNWKNFTKVEIVTINQFTSNHIRLNSYSTDSDFAYLKMQDEESKILRKVVKAFWYNSYWFENASEFIDVEGEWYRNDTDGFVYYKPFENENMAEVEVIAPYLETIVKIEGSSLDKPVQNLQFQGIEFSYASWIWPNQNGCIEHQAFHPFSANQTVSGNSEEMWTPPSGVYVAKADRIQFERCVFSHMGANGLNLHFGTHHCSISGNIVYDISGNGISEAKHNEDNVPWITPYRPKDLREICSNDIISNNYVAKCGVDYKGSVGIFCGMTSNVNITHNEVCQLPYSGISVGWGWCLIKDTTVMKNNKIEFNKVHQVNMDTLMWDGGGIYTLSNQPGSLCSNNYCTTNCRGLYFDQGTGFYSIFNNVVESGHDWINIWMPEQNNLVATDNYSSTLAQTNKGTNCIVKNTIFVPDKNWPKEAQEIINNAGLEDIYMDIKDKLKSQNQKINLDMKRVD